MVGAGTGVAVLVLAGVGEGRVDAPVGSVVGVWVTTLSSSALCCAGSTTACPPAAGRHPRSTVLNIITSRAPGTAIEFSFGIRDCDKDSIEMALENNLNVPANLLFPYIKEKSNDNYYGSRGFMDERKRNN